MPLFNLNFLLAAGAPQGLGHWGVEGVGMGEVSPPMFDLVWKLLYKWCCFRVFTCTTLMIITDQRREI